MKVVVIDDRAEVLEREYRRHEGQPEQELDRMLGRVRRRSMSFALGMTGSLGMAMAKQAGATALHEMQAIALASHRLLPGANTIIEIGGQDSKLLLRGDASGEFIVEMNDRCAAGTGATLDRVRRRLGLTSTDVASASACSTLHVASRCGVFAETDVVNLIKRGVPAQRAFGALAHGVVVQNLAVLAKGRVLRPPVALLGGPHAYVPALAEAWVRLLESLWRSNGDTSGEVRVPSYAEFGAAIGAAIHATARGSSLRRSLPLLPEAGRSQPSVRLESFGRRARFRLRTRPLRGGSVSGLVRGHLGIDAGSTTSKVVVLDDAGQVLLASQGMATGSPIEDLRLRIIDILEQCRRKRARVEVLSAGVTGYGSEMVEATLGADATVVETVAHATSAYDFAPETDVVVDSGGTDIKILQLGCDGILDFHLSNQCSAGQGSFLSASAAELGVDVTELSEIALSAQRMPNFTVGCGIFMDTDRVGFHRDGFTPAEILAGLAWAVVRNTWEFVLPIPPERLGRNFLLTGGTHRFLAVALSQDRYLRTRVPHAVVRVHPHPEFCGAIGAALVAKRSAVRGSRTSFIGLEAALTTSVETASGNQIPCSGCELRCARSVVSVRRPRRPARTIVLGNTCEIGSSVSVKKRAPRARATDLVVREARALFRSVLRIENRGRDGPVIAVPRVAGMYRCAPLLLHYLRAAGVPRRHIIVTPSTPEVMSGTTGGWGSAHDPCFPAKLVGAHVQWVLSLGERRPIDAILLPTVTHAAIDIEGTADTASCPIVAANGYLARASLRRRGSPGIPILTPELSLLDHDRLAHQMFQAFGPLLGLDRPTSDRALAFGLRAQATLREQMRERGSDVVDAARAGGRGVAVLLARPYHVDPGVLHGVTTALAVRDIPVLSLMALSRSGPPGPRLASALRPVTNSGCAEKLWAADVIAGDPNLLAVEVSSFRCGQDASIYADLERILAHAGKPILRLHDLDEDRPGISLRLRVETFVDSVRRYESRELARRSSRSSDSSEEGRFTC